MVTTLLRVPAGRPRAGRRWLIPVPLALALLLLPVSRSGLNRSAFAQASCLQWDITGVWNTTQSNGYTLVFNFGQRGTTVFGNVSATGKFPDGRPAADTGTLKNDATLVGDQLDFTVAWTRITPDAGQTYEGHYHATITPGTLDGTTGSGSSSASWHGTGPTVCVTSGTPMVWTVNDAGIQNPPSYELFDDIQYCFSTPGLGASVLTHLTPDGNSTVVSQYGGDATSQCVPDVVLFDGGQECLQLAFTPVQGGVSGATQTTQVCWGDRP